MSDAVDDIDRQRRDLRIFWNRVFSGCLLAAAIGCAIYAWLSRNTIFVALAVIGMGQGIYGVVWADRIVSRRLGRSRSSHVDDGPTALEPPDVGAN